VTDTPGITERECYIIARALWGPDVAPYRPKPAHFGQCGYAGDVVEQPPVTAHVGMME
jgi:hypothetical protein